MGKRILILTGAGAAWPWFNEGSEITTKTITDVITYNPFRKKILKQLKKHYNEPDSINFETIINTLENMLLYYRGQNYPLDSEMPVLFNLRYFVKKHFRNDSPESIPSIIADNFYEALCRITPLIENYSQNLKSLKFEKNNSHLRKLLEAIKNQSNIIRAYTTNYDQMFVDVTEELKGISFSNGFFNKNKNSHKEYDLDKIRNSEDNNCYYNLHGSIYWHWLISLDNRQSRFVQMQMIFDEQSRNVLRPDSIQMANPEEPYLNSPIITGYHKLQRINQEPFNAFSHAFYRDCHKADIFIFIGFSFNDSHINNVLSHVDWKGKKVLIFDKCNDPLNHKGIQNFKAWCGEEIDLDVSDITHIVNLYNEGFGDFLEEYPSILKEAGIEL